MKYLYSMLLGVTLFSTVAMQPVGVQAETDDPLLTQVGTAIGGSKQELPVTIAEIIKFILSLLGMIALILVIYAGFLWMFGGTDEKKIATARSIMLNGAIGLLIIMSAYSITDWAFKALTTATTGN